jgi:hypothetical protein
MNSALKKIGVITAAVAATAAMAVPASAVEAQQAVSVDG